MFTFGSLVKVADGARVSAACAAPSSVKINKAIEVKTVVRPDMRGVTPLGCDKTPERKTVIPAAAPFKWNGLTKEPRTK